MSTSRGNTSRKRPQKHQNKTVFKNDLHDTSRRTKLLNSLEVSGVCNRCKEIIEWKIKYKKYKPLTAPAKCVGCSEKAVKYAYHVLCSQCSTEKKVCAKCCKPLTGEVIETISETITRDEDFEEQLKNLPERKRRTILRHLKKLEENKDATVEDKVRFNDVINSIKDFKLDDDSDFDFSSDEEGLDVECEIDNKEK